MDNDSGWAAREITLSAKAAGQAPAEITLPCRWVELVQAWNGVADSYFLVSGVPEQPLPDAAWDELSFHDAAGRARRFPIARVLRAGPALKVMRYRGTSG
ncbi:hypothetical protein [Acidisoma sp. C75]